MYWTRFRVAALRAISFLPEGSLQPIAAHDLAVVLALSFMALRERAHDGHKQNRPALLRWAAMVAERTRIVNLVQSPLEGSGKRL